MDSQLFDDLERSLATQGPQQAIAELCRRLEAGKEYNGLFYALLLKKRHELGVSPIPTAPSQDLPPETHAPYEEGIREAVRVVGNLFLADGNIPAAYSYFRMTGENEAVARAIEAFEPGEGEDISSVVQIAFYEGVQPRRGFDLILGRFGLCNAITTAGSHEQMTPEVRQYCVSKLVRALHDELRERLRSDIERKEGTLPPEGTSVRNLLTGRDYLFEDDFAHIDTSHLSSVVQMSLMLPPSEVTPLVRELCAYGQRISPRLRFNADPPFQDSYRDYDIYLSILMGDNADEGIRHFAERAAQADPESEGTYAAEVLVNLLLRVGRAQQALETARRFLVGADMRRLSCPSVLELCQRSRDFSALADAARKQNDPVHFLAGLLETRSPRK